MSYQESYCPSCAAVAEAGLKAPPGWYRCPACHEALPRHKLPRRTVQLSMGLLAGRPAPYFLPFALSTVIEQA